MPFLNSLPGISGQPTVCLLGKMGCPQIPGPSLGSAEVELRGRWVICQSVPIFSKDDGHLDKGWNLPTLDFPDCNIVTSAPGGVPRKGRQGCTVGGSPAGRYCLDLGGLVEGYTVKECFGAGTTQFGGIQRSSSLLPFSPSSLFLFPSFIPPFGQFLPLLPFPLVSLPSLHSSFPHLSCDHCA